MNKSKYDIMILLYFSYINLYFIINKIMKEINLLMIHQFIQNQISNYNRYNFKKYFLYFCYIKLYLLFINLNFLIN